MTTTSPVELRGVVPVIPTPFRKDESIDFDGLAACVDFAVHCDVGAVCLPAYGSEFYKLTESERRQVVETAIRAATGRVAVMAQSNHPSACCAAALAKQHEQMGADLISFAIPRQFGVTEEDMLDYCRTICQAVSLPVLIQDFNPGGPTVGGEFARKLADPCENFRYLKLEEPLMSVKVRTIRAATDGRVGVLEGWGGMYLLDLIPAGICGLIPGLGPADLLQQIWKLGTNGQLDEALDLFQVMLPQLVFSLQNMELFLCLEKKLLASRGVLRESSTYVRRPTWTPDTEALEYGMKLNARVLEACRAL
ncbi:MAG: dihydrodipicolinate synthase family protein [Pirellulaceae bacterium]